MATLTNQTIASSYEQLLSLPDGGLNGTELVAITDGDSSTACALSVATTSISIGATHKLYLDAGGNTYIHEVSADKVDIVVGGQTILELSEGGGGASDYMAVQALNKFYLDGGTSTYIQESADGVMTFVCDARTMLTLTQGSAGTGEVCINEGSNSDVDFRVESNGEDEAILVDATNNKLDINLGETAFLTTIHNIDGEAVSVTATEVVINDDGVNTVDFRVESNGEDQAIFLDSNINTLYINKGETAFATHIYNTNDVVMSVGSAGVVFNEDGHATNDFRVESDNNAHMFFVNSGTDRISMGTAGASPDSVLHVKGANTTSTQAICHIECNEASADSGDVLFWLDWSGDAAVDAASRWMDFHDSDGTIGRLESSGTQIDTAFTQESDIRYKDNIRDTALKGLETLNKIKVRDFEFNEKYGASKAGIKVTAGFVADELYEVYPAATKGTPGAMKTKITPAVEASEGKAAVLDDDGNIIEEAVEAVEAVSEKTEEVIDAMGVMEGAFTRLLIKAVQELSASNDALKARIEVLEAA